MGHHGHDHHQDGHHDHDHRAPGSLRALLAVLGLTSVIFVAQLIGGFISGSLALLSDSMHMLSDSTGLIIALVATMVGRRAANERATYGYRRVEVLAALVNAAAVVAVSIWIVVGALSRLGSGAQVESGLMLAVAVVGLVANLISAAILARSKEESLNLRGAYLHVLVDAVSSLAVIVAALVIRFTGWSAADTVASLIIAAMVLPRALRLVWDTVSVLLERVPEGIDTLVVQRALAELDGVSTVHDLHIWSTDGQQLLATCHIVVAKDSRAGCNVLDAAQERLGTFGIEHSTIQIEDEGHIHHETVH